MIIAATGHRPDKLGGYAPEIANKLRFLAHRYLVAQRPTFVISGMALGWDQAIAQGAMLAGIPFVAAIPFAGQELKWSEQSQRAYREILAQAARIKIVCEGGYAPWKMQTRNEWMIDRSDKIVALWNGTPGGTANCIKYAQEKRCQIDNLWEQFK